MILFATGWSDAGARAVARRYPPAIWYEPGAATLADVIRVVTGAEVDVTTGPAPTDACAPAWCGPWAGAVRCDGTCRVVRRDGTNPDRRGR